MADRSTFDHIFWIDLETTGSTLDDNDIIEVGAAITNMDLEVVEVFARVLPMRRPSYNMKPVVLQMHVANGLWADVGESEYTKRQVDEEMAEMIARYSKDGNHLPFAGSGVAHFDRQFIRRDFPKSDKMLTYWPLDVGVLRRNFEFFTDLPWPAQSGKTHRALDDVLFHIEEQRHAVDMLRKVQYNGTNV